MTKKYDSDDEEGGLSSLGGSSLVIAGLPLLIQGVFINWYPLKS